jgi:hypothetical protein
MAEVLLKVTTGQVRVDCSGRGPVLHMAGTGETLAVASLFSAQHHCDAIASTNATVRVYAKRQVPDKDSKAGQAFSATLARQAYVLALSTASQRGVDNVMIFSEGRPLEAIKRMVSAQVDELREIGRNAKSNACSMASLSPGNEKQRLKVQRAQSHGNYGARQSASTASSDDGYGLVRPLRSCRTSIVSKGRPPSRGFPSRDFRPLLVPWRRCTQHFGRRYLTSIKSMSKRNF